MRLYYEVCGSGEPAVFLPPTWSIVHSRHWKMQFPCLAGAAELPWAATRSPGPVGGDGSR